MATLKSVDTKSIKAAYNDAEIDGKISSLKNEIAHLGASLAETGSREAKRVLAKGEALGEDAIATSRQALDSLASELESIEASLTSRIREKPLQSIGLAVGIGLIVAFLARR